MNRFVWSMAWRETRTGWQRYLFFVLSIAVGVAALTGIVSFSTNLEAAIQREARTLMAADLEVRTADVLDAIGQAALEKQTARGARAARLAELTSMAARIDTGASQLVEVKAVEGPWPFYGKLELSPDRPIDGLLEPGRIVVEPTLLAQLDIRVGDTLKLGGLPFTIAGEVRREPDRVTGAFSVGPRVLMRLDDVQRAGLLTVGSRVRYRYLLALPDGVDVVEVQKALEASLPAARTTVRTYREAQPQLRTFLDRMASFLSLTTLVTLLLGGLGVAQSVRVFLYQKRDTVAVLKVLGATTGEVTTVYLVQSLGLALAGSLLGIALGTGVQQLLPLVVGDALPVSVRLDFVPAAALEGLLMGLVTALLFALIPLLSIRGIPPARVLRREEELPLPRADRWRLAGSILLLGGGLLGMAAWLAGSLELGAIFLGGVVGAVVALVIAAKLLLFALRRMPRWASLAWRQGLANLHRPGSQASEVVVALGLGVAVIAMVYLVQANLLNRVSDSTPAGVPNFFFINLTPDQVDPLKALLEAQGAAENARLVPLVQSRLARLDQREVGSMKFASEEEEQFFTREFAVTHLRDLPDGNEVVAGAWWTPEEAAREKWISIEQRAAERLGVTVGSEVVLDIQGVQIATKVQSIRTVDWGRLQTNFFIICTEATLRGAPTSYVATVRSKPGAEARRSLQNAVVARMPNVTAIDAGEVVERVRSVLDRIAGVIRFMAASSIAAGVVILAGAIAATRFRRLKETAIFKALGATRAAVAQIMAVEYLVLGLAAGLVGTGVAAIFAWGVLTQVLEVPWAHRPFVYVAGPLLTAIATVLTGFLASAGVLAEKPLAVLRDE